ncbi:hypothetical protein [Alkalihalobacillus sp. R86527]|uniref:hypothetical protein n=1 Tax=Alkalihalobacillus sp. R86527 TaxID=3093863 RepID=UPI00366DD53E
MEIIFMFIVGLLVSIIAVIAIVKGITYRIQKPTEDVKEENSNLNKRIDDLENEREK